MFLGELEEILEAINMADFQKVMVPLFWRIGQCISSYHFQVSFPFLLTSIVSVVEYVYYPYILDLSKYLYLLGSAMNTNG